MNKDQKKEICINIFSAYFFIFSPQAKKSVSVDGTSVATIRMYQPTKYPFSIKQELKNGANEIVEKKDKKEKNEKILCIYYSNMHYSNNSSIYHTNKTRKWIFIRKC